ncbi:MAG: hypothetical protein JWM09_542 [Francisellaceae bacterium]|nr:hypothetical protein [Francisellaceae bacterium]
MIGLLDSKKSLAKFFLNFIIFYILLYPALSFANSETCRCKTDKIQLSFIRNSDEIDKKSAKTILINSFITEYRQYLKPKEIDPNLHIWLGLNNKNSVENYYSNYFDSEFHEFEKGNLYWVEAKINKKLIGWATFEKNLIPTNSIYMNLLVVDPIHQKKGIGKALVYSVKKLKFLPTIKHINLLLRKKNKGGRIFYTKLGFKLDPNFKRDNFVDISLLEGWTFNLKN